MIKLENFKLTSRCLSVRLCVLVLLETKLGELYSFGKNMNWGVFKKQIHVYVEYFPAQDCLDAYICLSLGSGQNRDNNLEILPPIVTPLARIF